MRYIETAINPFFVILSIIVSFFGAYGGITTFEQYRICRLYNIKPMFYGRNYFLLMTAFCVGGVAIWAMHFIGMSSVKFHSPDGDLLNVGYRIDLTIVSLVAVILVCIVALWIASADNQFAKDRTDIIDEFMKHKVAVSSKMTTTTSNTSFLRSALLRRPLPLVLGGITTGVGVCVMHYIGMLALVFEGEIEWDKGVVAASAVIAVVASTAAYWILFRLLTIFPRHDSMRCASALIMAIAVNGMHYTGMRAAKYRFIPGRSTNTNPTVSQYTATMGAIAAAVLLLWIVFLLVLQDIRSWFHELARIVREADRRLAFYSQDTMLARHPFVEDFKVMRSKIFSMESSAGSVNRNRVGSTTRQQRLGEVLPSYASMMPALAEGKDAGWIDHRAVLPMDDLEWNDNEFNIGVDGRAGGRVGDGIGVSDGDGDGHLV